MRIRCLANPDLQIKGLEALLNKHGSYFASDSKNYSRRYSVLGLLYCHQGDPRKARKALLKAVSLSPFRLNSYMHLMLSFLGAANFRRKPTDA